MREPVLPENRIERVAPYVAPTREAVADFRELIDVQLVPVLLKLLQWKGPEVPEARHVNGGMRAVPPAFYQCSGYLVGDVSPRSQLSCFLYLPNAPTLQVVPKIACGAALVLQENELSVR